MMDCAQIIDAKNLLLNMSNKVFTKWGGFVWSNSPNKIVIWEPTNKEINLVVLRQQDHLEDELLKD